LKPQYRIVIIYLIVGVLWIFFSDAFVDGIAESQEEFLFYQNLKGWFFIVATAAMLFLLIQHDILDITRLNRKLIESYDQTILGWIQVMDLRNKETKNHTVRVARMTVELARLSGIIRPSKLKRIERGAILHDLGKMGIPDHVLIKPGKLTEEEWAVIREHPQIAYDILSGIKFLARSIAIPYCHHEKWDGSGYPNGLKGKEIPRAARIFAVVDVWDALIHPRVYKDAWPEEQVLQYIQEQSGKHFDPVVVETFLNNYAVLKHSTTSSSLSLSLSSL
jgi:HD-GYP domain-containing protein (c-di-GMP phosphodiesterase class II)